LQAIGCLGMRACSSNNCPVGIATQKESLRKRIIIDSSARQLYNFFTASNDLIKVVARSCGHSSINKFNFNDLSTLNYNMHQLTGIHYAGIH
jgi:glutamate synthase domain-containing protein 2